MEKILEEYIERDVISYLFEELSEFKKDSIKNCVKLLEDGATIPFIARYRKEATGGLDEVELQKIRDTYNYFKELEERKKVVFSSIKEQGKLTPQLADKIINCKSKKELEDLYLPFKPKKRSRAKIAREKGLLPLSQLMLTLKSGEKSIEDVVKPFVKEDKGVKNIGDALKGAMDIIAEMYSESSDIRKFVRFIYLRDGKVISNVKEEFKDKKTKFMDYYEYSEEVSKIPSHRFLAIKRGEKEKVLKVTIAGPDETVLDVTKKFFISEDNLLFLEYVEKAIEDGYRRLLLPSIKLDVMAELKNRSDDVAISVFEKNLRSLLLQPPEGSVVVLGIDPGYRTGCKVAVVDETGKFLENSTIYPVPPFNKFEESGEMLLKLIEKYDVKAIAIGNGTASSETTKFVKNFVKKGGFNIKVKVVNESGASVYSASKVAREEFPDLDVTVRGAISIARRYQDPLSELVKIDPKSIGVGQYQHDVNQVKLKSKLKEVVEFCVNQVGVDLNTTSVYLLSYISGISEGIAKKIVNYRDEKGKFKNRMELLNVSGLGEKTFEQCAGFLRIKDGDNPLDKTLVHPESYSVVEEILKKYGKSIDEVMGNEEFLSGLKPEEFALDGVGVFSIKDIIDELKKAGRDIRGESESFEFKHNFSSIEDLIEGVILDGIITNVTNFGIFVDIGVHQDGLVHISNLKKEFVRNPAEYFGVGEKVKVKVLSVDRELKRIQLSMKDV